jgi:hypothetical protein
MNMFRLNAKVLLAIVVSSSTIAMGQSSTTSTARPAAEPIEAKPRAAIFQSDALGFTLTYPASLIETKLPSQDQQHAEIAKVQPLDEKPELRKVDQCTDKALLAQRKDDPEKAGVNVTIFGDKRGTVLESTPAVTATLLIARVGIECMPAEYRQQLEAVTSAMAEGSAQGDDLKPIDQPIWYEIGKTRVHFAAAQSILAEIQPGANASSQPTKGQGRRWVASLAFVQNGNLVSIYAESNNLPFLNGILHSTVKFGDQSAAPLFPADLGNGSPIQPKP